MEREEEVNVELYVDWLEAWVWMDVTCYDAGLALEGGDVVVGKLEGGHYLLS